VSKVVERDEELFGREAAGEKRMKGFYAQNYTISV
jgi:hypothetical protein